MTDANIGKNMEDEGSGKPVDRDKTPISSQAMPKLDAEGDAAKAEKDAEDTHRNLSSLMQNLNERINLKRQAKNLAMRTAQDNARAEGSEADAFKQDLPSLNIVPEYQVSSLVKPKGENDVWEFRDPGTKILDPYALFSEGHEKQLSLQEAKERGLIGSSKSTAPEEQNLELLAQQEKEIKAELEECRTEKPLTSEGNSLETCAFSAKEEAEILARLQETQKKHEKLQKTIQFRKNTLLGIISEETLPGANDPHNIRYTADGKPVMTTSEGLWGLKKDDRSAFVKFFLKSSNSIADEIIADYYNPKTPQSIVTRGDNQEGFLILHDEDTDLEDDYTDDPSAEVTVREHGELVKRKAGRGNSGRIAVLDALGIPDHLATTDQSLVGIGEFSDESINYVPIAVSERAFQMIQADGRFKELTKPKTVSVFNEYVKRARQELQQFREEGKWGYSELQEFCRKFARSNVFKLRDGEKAIPGNKVVYKIRYKETKDKRELEHWYRECAIARLHRPRLERTLIISETTGARPCRVSLHYPLVPWNEIFNHLSLEQFLLEVPVPVAKELKEIYDIFNVVHRDIKPDNLFYSKRDGVIIPDFGIAKVENVSCTRTRDAGVGTPMFVSPEQVKSAAVDFKSDIYSLACSIYSIVKGKEPITGILDPMAVMYTKLNPAFRYETLRNSESYRKAQEQGLFAGREARKKLENLEYVLSWAMQQDPEDRPLYNQFVEDMESVARGSKPEHFFENLAMLKEKNEYKISIWKPGVYVGRVFADKETSFIDKEKRKK